MSKKNQPLVFAFFAILMTVVSVIFFVKAFFGTTSPGIETFIFALPCGVAVYMTIKIAVPILLRAYTERKNKKTILKSRRFNRKNEDGKNITK